LKRFILTAVLALSLVLSSGCGPGDLSLARLQEKVAAAVPGASTVKSQQFTSEILISATEQPSVSITTYAETDYAAASYYSEFTLETPSTGSQLAGIQYLVGDWSYYSMAIAAGTYDWAKIKSSFTDVRELDRLNVLLAVAGANTIVTKDDLNGTACYVVQVEATQQAILDWLRSQKLFQLGYTGIGDLTAEDVASCVLKEWIAEDTFLPVRLTASVWLTIPLDPTQTADGTPDERYQIDIETRFYDYNEPLDIVLPPEAAAASELPLAG
jgi:hypothetical protein